MNPNIVANSSSQPAVSDQITQENRSPVIQKQLNQKRNFQIAMDNERKELFILQRELAAIEKPITEIMLQNLSSEIRQLLSNCNRLAQKFDEVDTRNQILLEQRCTSSPLELKTNFNQTNSLNTCRSSPPPIPIALRTKLDRNVLTQMQQRSPNENNHHQRQQQQPFPSGGSGNIRRSSSSSSNSMQITNSIGNSVNDINGQTEETGWTCNMCTFRNNCYLTKCEQCDMPFLPNSNNISGNMVFRQMQQQQ